MIDLDYKKAVQLAKTHKRLYHYTSLEALGYILNNESLKLNRIDQLNDVMENTNILDLWKSKVYVACFTYRDNEAYFFWETYAKGCTNGVRISFDRESLLGLSIHPDEKCIDNRLNSYESKHSKNKSFDCLNSASWSISDYSLVDIMYVPRGTKIGDDSNYLGRIKYLVWDMELETRLRVAVRPNIFEYKDELDNENRFVRIVPKDKVIFAKLSDKCLNSMVITLSPYADDEVFETVKNLLIQNKLDDKIQVEKSVLCNDVRKKDK